MNDTDQGPTAEDTIPKNDDSFLALVILVTALALAVGAGILFWRYKKYFVGTDDSWKQNSFSPPPARAIYIEAKEKLDPAKVPDLDELKKLLMRRAIQTIPILLSLQNEGSSIERLYKRGMLTDDMHFKVKELKAFVDQEFQDVQYEADDLVEGWGQHIWPQAMQFHQMIQKQAESKNEEQKAAEEDKKKTESQKKREKEKAKKQSAQKKDAPEVANPVATGPIVELSEEELKAKEAERMAQLLLEEEEREKQTSSGGSKKKKEKTNKK